MTTEDFIDIHRDDTPLQMLDTLTMTMSMWTSDAVTRQDAYYQRNDKEVAYWNGEIEAMRERAEWLRDRIRAALSKADDERPIEARLHLCESCAKVYPECDATREGMVFGCGVGNDNVVGCTAYANRWTGPKLMTVYDMFSPDGAVYIEYNGERLNRPSEWAFVDFIIADGQKPRANLILAHGEKVTYGLNGMGVSWRCWTKKPSTEQRKAVKWE